MSCCPCFAFAKSHDGEQPKPGNGAQNVATRQKSDSERRRDEKQARAEAKRVDKISNKRYEDIVHFLENVPLMHRLPRDQIPIVAANCEHRRFSAGEAIFRQGEIGHEFFMIQSGTAVAFVAGPDGSMTKVNELKEGDSFGKNSLFSDVPRSATIEATSVVECLSLTREKFQELGLHDKVQFPKRHRVGAGDKTTAKKKPPDPKTADDREMISQALRKNKDLQAMVSLDDDRIARMIEVAWKEKFAAGDFIIKENDTEANYFYIVAEGSASIIEDAFEEDVRASHLPRSSGRRKRSRGDSFGELALLYLMPRLAAVKADEDCTVWVFDRDSFKKIMMRASEEKIDEYLQLLEEVEILDTLTQFEKREIAEALVEMRFSKGEIVLQQGEVGNGFYMMYEGSVSVSVNGKEVRQLEVTPNDGDEVQCFGEKALLKNEPRTATVQVISEKATMLVLDRDTFELLLRPLEDIIKNSLMGRRPTDGHALSDAEQKRATTYELMQKSKRAQLKSKKSFNQIEQQNLQKIGLLGNGGFGKVELMEHRPTGDTFALKMMSKGFIVKQHMQASILNEKRILSMMDSPFIIKLYSTYNLPQEIHFLLEPALGGELYATYHFNNFHGSQRHARYYSAGVVCAFEYLHERRVIYRDLKPENVLLNELGHLKLTDMGLAKFIIGKTYTTCGTPDYFAPEVITSAGHNFAVDWWCLGVLLFELHAVSPPFEANNVMHIYAKVRSGIGKVVFPSKCQGAVKDLIVGLLQSNPSERLAMRRGGVMNVKQHPWYVESFFNWEDHYYGKMEAPYKPQVKTKKDISNFRARADDAPPMVFWQDDGSGWDKEF